MNLPNNFRHSTIVLLLDNHAVSGDVSSGLLVDVRNWSVGTAFKVEPHAQVYCGVLRGGNYLKGQQVNQIPHQSKHPPHHNSFTSIG